MALDRRGGAGKPVPPRQHTKRRSLHGVGGLNEECRSSLANASHSSSALRFADSVAFRPPSRPTTGGAPGSRRPLSSPTLPCTSLSFIRHPFRAYEKGTAPPAPVPAT